MIVVILVAIIISIVNLINPAFAWHLRGGWMVKGDSEPSDGYLFTQRIGSVVGLIVLVPMLIVFILVV